MAKSHNLPSVDGYKGPPVSKPTELKSPPPEPPQPEYIEHVSRNVDIRMTGKQPLKFRRIMRHLEDSGETLANGSPVNNKSRTALWLIENFDLKSK